VCVGLGIAFESRIFFALAYTAFFLNLFNLIPFSPLDGGRVVQAFSRRAWIFGAVLLLGLFFVTRAPQLLLIFIMALGSIFGRGSNDPRPVLSRGKQWGWAGRYFALAALLAFGIFATSLILHPHIHEDGEAGEGINALGRVLPGPA
jgi:Zn-dependent protease